MKSPPIIIGISGASGIIYGVKLLQVLRELAIETHLVVTKTADRTRAFETDLTASALRELADVNYPIADLGAAIASGSFRTAGMIISPCSMRTLAEIATGASNNLLTRAADVVLKERRRLVMMVRETPLHNIHLKNMLSVTEAGAIVFPPVPAFYTRPQTLDDIVNQTVGRVLDLFGIDTGEVIRWGSNN